MESNKKSLEYMAKLSKISLSQQEKEELTMSMQKIVECMDKLKDIDALKVEPMEHISTEINILREDQVLASLERDIIFSNAPEHQDGCYVVPRIVD